jgi:rare lipoprotein A
VLRVKRDGSRKKSGDALFSIRVIIYCATLATLIFACAPAKYDIQQGKIAKFYVVASWYGPDFQGRPTASGETFDMHAMTCAHKEYPFGTKLRVTNTANGKSVECIVNDRGPFVKGRDIDLSYAAAREIDLIAPGTAPVAVEVQGRDAAYIKTVIVQATHTGGPFAIQVGSFREGINAVRLKVALKLTYANAYVQEALIDGTIFYRVRVGNFDQITAAMQTAEKLGQEGYPAIILRADMRM